MILSGKAWVAAGFAALTLTTAVAVASGAPTVVWLITLALAAALALLGSSFR